MNNPQNYAKNFKARALACKEAAGHTCKECGIVRGTELVSWAGRVCGCIWWPRILTTILKP